MSGDLSDDVLAKIAAWRVTLAKAEIARGRHLEAIRAVELAKLDAENATDDAKSAERDLRRALIAAELGEEVSS